MTKRHWLFFVYGPLILTWLADRLTKVMAEQMISGVHFFGPVGFLMHHNTGIMLGLFSSLPPVLRVVSLSTGGAFLFLIFFSIQYLLPSKSYALRAGLAILLGGILGNVFDRIAFGYIIDFIVFGNMQMTSPAFNIADALQWVGYGFIMYGLIKDGKNIWPENNNRKSFFINAQYQLKYVRILLLFGLAFAIVAGTYSYTYMRITIIELVGHQVEIEDRFLIPFILTFLVVSGIFIIFLFFIGLIFSHRAAGPIYAFEKFLEDLTAGKMRPLRLRGGDDFTHLEEVAENLTQKLAVHFPQQQLPTDSNSNSDIPDLPIGNVKR